MVSKCRKGRVIPISFLEHTLQGRGEEFLVGLLVLADLLQVGIEGVLQPGVDKVSLGIVLEALLVESSLKVLQSQSVVEDVG